MMSQAAMASATGATGQAGMSSAMPYSGQTANMGSHDSPNTFPKDPRDWTRDHVIHWLLWATSHYKIEPVNVEKFHMNGRGLTYLTKDGFLKRAPAGGEKLFEDFKLRFANAILQERRSKSM